jgi:hypothetical protein
MRKRITFVHDAEGPFDPKQAPLGGDVLSIRSLQGAREERVTFGFNELPQEVRNQPLPTRTRLELTEPNISSGKF